ncbi:MAG: hypothetical protein HY958_10565 [Bacteroidia bacterium]|nr:hypothetical protein [Bacteroidia bacterium]
MAFDLNEWYYKKKSDNVLFSFKGAITSGKITHFLEIIEKKLDGIEDNYKLKRKLYNVLVESMQNLYHHAEPVPGELKSLCDDGDYTENCKFGIFFLDKVEIGYVVTVGNFVKKSRMQLFIDKFEQLNALSPDEIKALYRLILNNHEFTDRGGGGMGMIDIVKRTEAKFIYNFHDFNKELSFYSSDINVY